MFSRLQILRKVHYSRLCFLGNGDEYEDCTSTPIYIRHTAKRKKYIDAHILKFTRRSLCSGYH
jgi:hypothetical protein